MYFNGQQIEVFPHKHTCQLFLIFLFVHWKQSGGTTCSDPRWSYHWRSKSISFGNYRRHHVTNPGTCGCPAKPWRFFGSGWHHDWASTRMVISPVVWEGYQIPQLTLLKVRPCVFQTGWPSRRLCRQRTLSSRGRLSASSMLQWPKARFWWYVMLSCTAAEMTCTKFLISIRRLSTSACRICRRAFSIRPNPKALQFSCCIFRKQP